MFHYLSMLCNIHYQFTDNLLHFQLNEHYWMSFGTAAIDCELLVHHHLNSLCSNILNDRLVGLASGIAVEAVNMSAYELSLFAISL